MEDLIAEIKKTFRLKSDTRVGDIVLIVVDKPRAMLYAQVAEITRDESRQAEWWHVTMNLLTFPPQKITWILREPQFSGKEIFSMGGEKRYVQALDLGVGNEPESGGNSTSGSRRPALRVIK